MLTSPQMPPGGYLALDMPERFMLQFRTADGGWMEEAVCMAAHTNRLEDGSYAIGTDGTGIMIRCVENYRDHIVHVDGTGECFEYRLLRIEPDGRIPLVEGGELLPKNSEEPAS